MSKSNRNEGRNHNHKTNCNNCANLTQLGSVYFGTACHTDKSAKANEDSRYFGDCSE